MKTATLWVPVLLLASGAVAQAAKCPLVLPVLDRSGSMTTTVPGGGGSRWQVATAALRDLVTAKGDQLPFGLLTFQSGTSCTDFTGEAQIAPAPGTKSAIVSELATKMPSGGTNTGQAIDKAVMMLAQGLTADPARMDRGYILLITDGDPTCGGSGMSAVDFTVARIQDARSRGLFTFVLGMEGASIANLNRMATAGGKPCTGTTCNGNSFYDAKNAAALNAAIAAITDEIQQGEFGGGACDDSCYSNGCTSAGEICVDGKCVSDPCRNYRNSSLCPKDAYCFTDGTSPPICLPICEAQCRDDEVCTADGTRCVPKPCLADNSCDCASITCPLANVAGGQACIDGKCVDDPCKYTQCPAGTTCRPGYGYCVGQTSSDGGVRDPGRPKRGCEIGGGASGGALPFALALVALALRVARKRREP